MNRAAFDASSAGREILARAESLSRHSDSPVHYTRTWLSPAHRAAAAQLAEWMREAGMAVRVDGAGSVIGRYEGLAPGANALVTGSHFDSVRNGGKYDGVLGILVPIACVAQLHRQGLRLAHAIEVVAFADEEGARFQTSFLASRAFLGQFDPAIRDRRDADGIGFDEAMRVAGLDPAAIAADPRDPATIAAYVEVHIEQGPVLLEAGLPLGVVTAIAGGTRHRVTVTGAAGHAGTVPMASRRDALAAAAEMVLAVESRAKSGGGLVGTVGVLEVREGTGNVIPGRVEFTVDIRSGDDAIRLAAERDVFARFEAIAARRGVTVSSRRNHAVNATPCSPRLQELLAESVAAVGAPVRRLASGAGHDAMVLASATEVGMIFVRCGAGGVSHDPAETVAAQDAGLAVAALGEFLSRFRPPG
ncbi:MAG: allantoate amidohydrolase [Betaproteobacteria bacterium]|nr:allantoate amidohydrolase [Betaproteobacteria bacterium]